MFLVHSAPVVGRVCTGAKNKNFRISERVCVRVTVIEMLTLMDSRRSFVLLLAANGIL